MKSSRIETLDDRLIKASKKIKVLSTLAWPVGIAEKFLQDWDKGNASLPEISIVAPDVDAGVRELDSIASTCDEANPD